MAVTVTTDLAFFQGLTTTSTADTATGWSSGTLDTEAQVEGTGCLSLKVSNITSAAVVFTIGNGAGGTATQDVTGKNMYGWVAGAKVAQWDTQANGGIRLRVDDGTRYSEWFVAGNDTIPHQGWICHSVNFGDQVGAAVAYKSSTTTYTTETTAANDATTNDMNLLPATGQGVDDAYYFGHSDRFRELLINFNTAGVGVWTVTWEYWNGSAWTALSGVTDNTTGFKPTVAGAFEYTVKFTKPTDWYTTTVNSITNMYWIRGRVSAFTSIVTQPKGTRAWVRFGTTPNRAGLIVGDTNDGIEANYSAITKIGLRMKTIVTASRINTFWDGFRIGTKLSVKTTASSIATFADFLTAENTNAYGVITPSEGILNIQGKLEFGSTTSGDTLDFVDTNYHLRFRKSFIGNLANQIVVVGNGTANTNVTFGALTTASGANLTTGGLLIDTNDATNNRWVLDITNTNNTTVKLYGVKFSGASRISFGSASTKVDNVHLVGCKFEANDAVVFNLDSADTTSLNDQNSFASSSVSNAVEIYEVGLWTRQSVASNTRGLVIKSTTITFTLNTTTFANNTTDLYFWQPTGTATVNLVDSTDSIVVSQDSTLNWNLYEKTTYDLNLKDSTGSNINAASARLEDANLVEQYVGLTDSNGNITQQKIKRRSREYTGTLATTTHNPYVLRMRKYQYVPQEISGKSLSASATSDSFVLLTDSYATDSAGTVAAFTGITVGESVALAGAVADDGGSQTVETTAANNGTANDMNLVAASGALAVNDAYYFAGSYKFAKLSINIGTAGSGVWENTWEYYNGSWTALSGVAESHTNAKHFRPASSGSKYVSWTMPSDWVSTTVQSISGYWVRARVTTGDATPTTRAKGTQAFLEEQIQLSTTTHSLLHVYEYMRYYSALTSPDHMNLKDPMSTADGVTFQVTNFAFQVSGVDLSGAASILSMPTRDFTLVSSGSQGLKKLTDIDGTAVSLQLTNVVTGSRCFIIDTAETSKTISSITASGGAISITTSSAHGLSVDHLFEVSGTVAFDGNYTVATVPSSTTLTTTETHATGTESTGTLIRILMNKTAASSTVAQSYVYPGSDRTITVRVRKSSAATKYLPYETGGTITSDGSSNFISQVEDSTAE
jgi:hypothetical protein